MRQISKGILRKSRADAIAVITRHLEQTAWSKGGQIMTASRHGRRTDGRVVASWPGARPAQIRAGARKLYDVVAAQVRREQKAAVQG